MPCDMLAAAQHYFKLGYTPIPITHRGKQPPKGFSWKKYQTQAPTPTDLKRWFGNGPVNLALVLGRGTFAIDIDSAAGAEALRANGVELPDLAPCSITAKGLHILLEGKAADAVGVLPGVDIRGVGYIVAPPSIHASGHIYTWKVRPGRVDDLPQAPPTLLALLAAGNGPAGALAPPGDPKWVAKALLGAPAGQRDALCARLAGYFLGKGLPTDIVASTLYAFGDRCTPPFPHDQVDKTVASVARKEQARDADAPPFQFLGYNNNNHFYLPKGSRQVTTLRTDWHGKGHLLGLASLDYWESAFPGKAGAAWDMATNALLRRSEQAGVFDQERLRGRGAWWEGDRAVLHLGDTLIVDGQRYPVDGAPRGRYIYEAAPPLEVDLADPLSAVEAVRFMDLAEGISWERPISAKLFAGWAAVAPVCGALSWRPHMWLTGGAGAGKSWIVNEILCPLLGELGLAVQSETTEAGLRQTLHNDARPVVFDEAEGEDARAQVRIQNVLALMRQASSESGSAIIKGSASGQAKVYKIRSCFAFSSIGVGVVQHADATRVSVLSLVRDENPARFAHLKKMRTDILTQAWIRRLRARIIGMIPVIRANAEAFAVAGASEIGSQRMGDQVGTLLAGAYALYSDAAITPIAAAAWMAAQDWTDQRAVADAADEQRCLQMILEHIVTVRGKYNASERTLGELVVLAGGRKEDHIAPHEAAETLLRFGLRVVDDHIIVASSHSALARILANTPWVKDWARILRRLPGATPTTGAVRFAGIQTRGVQVPMEILEIPF